MKLNGDGEFTDSIADREWQRERERQRCACEKKFVKLRMYLKQWQCLNCGMLEDHSTNGQSK